MLKITRQRDTPFPHLEIRINNEILSFRQGARLSFSQETITINTICEILPFEKQSVWPKVRYETIDSIMKPNKWSIYEGNNLIIYTYSYKYYEINRKSVTPTIVTS